MVDESRHALAEGALILTIRPPLAFLVLNRPEARNALNQAMWRAIPEAVERVAGDAAVRAVILSGADGDFASGADISEFGDIFESAASAGAYLALMEAAGRALETLEKPVIAHIEGYCIGAGLALALACDLRIAAASARLGAPPAKLGLVYGPADLRRLVSAVGPQTARSMLFTAALVPADAAQRFGLVAEIHEAGAAQAAEARALEMAALSQWSIRRTKALIALLAANDPHAERQGRIWFEEAVAQGDLQEGLNARAQRRPPAFGS